MLVRSQPKGRSMKAGFLSAVAAAGFFIVAHSAKKSGLLATTFGVAHFAKKPRLLAPLTSLAGFLATPTLLAGLLATPTLFAGFLATPTVFAGFLATLTLFAGFFATTLGGFLAVSLNPVPCVVPTMALCVRYNIGALAANKPSSYILELWAYE